MGLPAISEYISSVTNPFGLFRSLGDIVPDVDYRGELMFFAGNNAAVFPVTAAGRRIALKCYIKNGLNTETICRYLAEKADPLLASTRLLPKEVFVYDVFGAGCYHDVVVLEWIDGVTLETEIRRVATEYGETKFGELSVLFDNLACEILAREWAHGDIKPENMILTNDRELRLIDYDAMFVPQLRGYRTVEIGTPSYQHPLRDDAFYNEHIDDYSIAIISVSLRALAVDAGLWRQYCRGDNILFYPDEIMAGCSEAYDHVLKLFASVGDHASYDLALKLRSGSPVIEGLADCLKRPRPVRYRTCARTAGYAADVCGGYAAETDMVDDGAADREADYPVLFEQGDKRGYRRENGETVVRAIYDAASDFCEDMAAVCLHGIWQMICTDGSPIMVFPDFEELKPFSGGLAAFRRSGKWGYIDAEGNIAVEPRFDMAGYMRDGLSLVKLEGKYGYMDRNGNVVIEPIYDYATGFRDGRANVSLDGEIFTIDGSGSRI